MEERQAHHRKRLARLAHALRTRKESILSRWEASVREARIGDQLSQPALRDGLPTLFDQLVAHLESGEQREALLQSESSGHSMDRLSRGFDQDAVLHEYALLRQCLLQAWEEELGDGVRLSEVRMLDRILDTSLRQAAVRFQKVRHYLLGGAKDAQGHTPLEQEPGTALHTLLQRALEAMECLDVAVALTLEGETLRVRASAGLPRALLEGRLEQVGAGLAGTVAAEGQPVQVSSGEEEPLLRSAGEGAIRALLGLPLLAEQQRLGVLLAGSRQTGRFSPDEQRLLEEFASRLATVVLRERFERTQREVREALEEAHAQLDTFFEATPVGLALVDASLSFVRVNPALAAINGLEARSHQGRSLSQVLPELAPRLAPYLLSVLETGQPVVNMEVNGVTPAAPGREHSWLVNYYPVHRASQGTTAVGVAVTDITERKQVERALEARARQQSVVSELGIRALRAPNLQALMEEAVAAVSRTLGTELSKVLELCPDGTRLGLRAGVGWKEGLVGQATVSAGRHSQAGYTLLSAEPVIVEDLRTETRFQAPRLLLEHGCRSGMSVVIHAPGPQGRPYGVLSTHSRTCRGFSRDDAAFLQAVANLIAAVLLRMRTEEELQRSEERFRLLVSGVTDYALFMLDPGGRVASWNEGAERVYGYRAEEILGRELSTFYRADEMKRGRPGLALEVARSTGRFEDEGWRVCKNGRSFCSSDVLSLVRAPGGEVFGFAQVSRDLSGQKRGEKDRFLAEVGRKLSESVDLETTLQHSLQLALPRLGDWCGLVLVEEGRVRRVEVQVVDPEQLELARALASSYAEDVGSAGALEQVVRDGATVLFADAAHTREAEQTPAVRFLRPHGLKSYLAVPLTARGTLLGALWFATQESGRYLGQESVELAEEFGRRCAMALDNARLFQSAQEAVHAREEVLSVVSHDLRNLLSALSSRGTLLVRGTAQQPEGPVHRHAQALHQSVKRMERLVDDLSDLGSIRTGRLAVDLQPNETGAILREVFDTFEPLATSLGLHLELALDEHLPECSCDRERVMQVLSNLLSNALKVTPAGGTIRLQAMAEDEQVRLGVSDTGPGIPEEERSRIFELHRRGSTARYKGTGRGLTIARGIVEAHGGVLWVESTLGRGSSFFFTLPQRAARAPYPSVPRPS